MQNSHQIDLFQQKYRGLSDFPGEYKLYQNFPQTFYKITRIGFDIPETTKVKLIICDVFGRYITVLIENELNAGSYEVKWNAYNLQAGVYYYKIIAGDFIDSKKVFLIKN